MPAPWHRRQAMMLASQLPENHADAVLVVQAVRELLDTFLAAGAAEIAEAASNILPFTAG